MFITKRASEDREASRSADVMDGWKQAREKLQELLSSGREAGNQTLRNLTELFWRGSGRCTGAEQIPLPVSAMLLSVLALSQQPCAAWWFCEAHNSTLRGDHPASSPRVSQGTKLSLCVPVTSPSAGPLPTAVPHPHLPAKGKWKSQSNLPWWEPGDLLLKQPREEATLSLGYCCHPVARTSRPRAAHTV
jgi:hypothetical protein